MLRCCGSRLVDLADLLACIETYVDLGVFLDIFEYAFYLCGYLDEMLGSVSPNHCLCGSKYGDPVTP